MTYDSVLSEAKRLLTIFRDSPWAKEDMVNLFPHLVDEVERLSENDRTVLECECEIEELQERVGDIEDEIESLEHENDELTKRIEELEAQLEESK